MVEVEREDLVDVGQRLLGRFTLERDIDLSTLANVPIPYRTMLAVSLRFMVSSVRS